MSPILVFSIQNKGSVKRLYVKHISSYLVKIFMEVETTLPYTKVKFPARFRSLAEISWMTVTVVTLRFQQLKAILKLLIYRIMFLKISSKLLVQTLSL